MDSVVRPEANIRLLGFVRVLRHCPRSVETYPMQKLAEDSGEYLSAVHGVRSLELSRIEIGPISQEDLCNCFSAFSETLTDLTLEWFTMSFSAFVTLIDYFPNISTLKFSKFAVKPDEGPVPPLSRPFRGKICVGYASANCVEFFNRFAKLDLEYRELVIGFRMRAELAEAILKLSTSTVKYLRLKAGLREYPYDTLSSLPIQTRILAF